MIVAKFGGAVLDGSEGLRRVCGEIRALPKPLLVVGSAFVGVTNRLERIAEAAIGDPSAALRQLDALVEYHAAIARELLSPAAFDEWLGEMAPFVRRLRDVVEGLGIVRELSQRTLDLVVHFGERFSSALLAGALADGDAGGPVTCISALDLIITDASHRYARPDLELTRERVEQHLRPALAGDAVVVTEGYIARSVSGQATTMGRESSDYTATLLAGLIGAGEVRIYRAVPGIMTADPHVLPGARTLGRVSYGMANTLAELGSKVLHPRTVVPVEHASIPLVITAIGGPATTIGVSGENGCSITLLPSAELIELDMETASAAIDPFLRGLGAHAPVIWHHRLRRRMQVLLSGAFPGPLPLGLIAEPVRVKRLEVAVVSLVCEEPPSGAALEQFFATVAGHFLPALQGGLDGHSISVALDRAVAHDAVRELHRYFVEQAREVERWQSRVA